MCACVCVSGNLLKVLTSEHLIASLHSPQTEDTDVPALPISSVLHSEALKAAAGAAQGVYSSTPFKMNWTLWKGEEEGGGEVRRRWGIISAGLLSECLAYAADTCCSLIGSEVGEGKKGR